MSQYVIGLDLGTTNSKAIVMDAHSHIVTSASSAYTMSSPNPGWAVQDVNAIWAGALDALRQIAQQISPREIGGICLSGAMQSLVPIDVSFEPLAPAMTWADNRSAHQAKELRADHPGKALLMRVGCPLQHVYNPARLRWWFQKAPEIASRTRYFVAIKDWILYRLTGILATDFGLASTTGLLDIRRLEWDEEAIALAGIHPDQLPSLVAPGKVVGGLVCEVAAITGLPDGLPVVSGTSDGGLANLGSGAILPGQRIVTVGTSGAVRKIVDQPWVDPEGRTWCYVFMEKRWFAGGAINNGGLTLQWVREKFYRDLPEEAGYEEMFADAKQVLPGSDGVLMLPYFTGERSPFWNPDATAVILGLGLQHQRRHITRAAMEGVAYCLANIWSVLQTSPDNDGNPVFLTGGICHNPAWAAIVADVLGVPLRLVDVADASATGAAMVGHLALGNVSNIEELTQNIQQGSRIEFDPNSHQYYLNQLSRYNSLYQMLEKNGWGNQGFSEQDENTHSDR